MPRLHDAGHPSSLARVPFARPGQRDVRHGPAAAHDRYRLLASSGVRVEGMGTTTLKLRSDRLGEVIDRDPAVAIRITVRTVKLRSKSDVDAENEFINRDNRIHNTIADAGR